MHLQNMRQKEESERKKVCAVGQGLSVRSRICHSYVTTTGSHKSSKAPTEIVRIVRVSVLLLSGKVV